jgi:hypothetical protein
MKYGYARVSTDGQSVDGQVRQLTKVGCKKVFREVASGAKTDRAQLRRLLDQLEAGDVLMVTRLDRLARSTRDLLNTLAAITGRKAGFRSLGDTWADTTASHGRLMLTVLGGLADNAESGIMQSDAGRGEVWSALRRCGAPHNPGSGRCPPSIGEAADLISRGTRAKPPREHGRAQAPSSVLPPWLKGDGIMRCLGPTRTS